MVEQELSARLIEVIVKSRPVVRGRAKREATVGFLIFDRFNFGKSGVRLRPDGGGCTTCYGLLILKNYGRELRMS